MGVLLPHCLSTATRMPARTLLVIATLTGACASPTAPGPGLAAVLADSRLVDLTYTFDESTLVWPTSTPFQLETIADGVTPDGYDCAAAANVTAFENLTSLEALPARGAVVFALPMKVGGGSGAPLRAVALVPR